MDHGGGRPPDRGSGFVYDTGRCPPISLRSCFTYVSFEGDRRIAASVLGAGMNRIGLQPVDAPPLGLPVVRAGAQFPARDDLHRREDGGVEPARTERGRQSRAEQVDSDVVGVHVPRRGRPALLAVHPPRPATRS